MPDQIEQYNVERSNLRQRDNRTDVFCTPSLEIALQRSLLLEEKLENDAEAETPRQALKRLLSTNSAISTSSSFAERQREAVGTNAPYREIGTGSIGKVFKQTGSVWALKLPFSTIAKSSGITISCISEFRAVSTS
jgi:hypothetical protein